MQNKSSGQSKKRNWDYRYGEGYGHTQRAAFSGNHNYGNTL